MIGLVWNSFGQDLIRLRLSGTHLGKIRLIWDNFQFIWVRLDSFEIINDPFK